MLAMIKEASFDVLAVFAFVSAVLAFFGGMYALLLLSEIVS